MAYRKQVAAICIRITQSLRPNSAPQTIRAAVEELREVAKANAAEAREISRLDAPPMLAVTARRGIAALNRAAGDFRRVAARLAIVPNQRRPLRRQENMLIDRYGFAVFQAQGYFRAIGIDNCGELAPAGSTT